MITYFLHKGKHRAEPFRFVTRILQTRLCKERSIHIQARFWNNCRYHIEGEDMGDINKLCGFTMGLVHKNSFRIGWRYNVKNDNIDLFFYSYENGNRRFAYLCSVDFMYPAKISMELEYSYYLKCYEVTIFVDDKKFKFFDVDIRHGLHISYPLSIYFGGNRTAPHDMNIDLKL